MIQLRMLVCGVSFSALVIFAANTASIPVDGDAGPAPASLNPESVNQTDPKLNDFQESRKKITGIKNQTPSRVTITVGEDNGFHYTVNGHTYSRERIAVSGEYYNDELHEEGFVRLFLVAEPSVSYYAVRPLDDRLDIYIQNYFYEDFYYEILTPYPVSGYDLRHGQINATSVLVTGPSRSSYDRRKSHGTKKSTLVTSKKPSHA